MADFTEFLETLLKNEGGFTDDPNDHGGATNLGITLTEWIAKGWDRNDDGIINLQDLKLLTEEDAATFFKSEYWDAVRADEIESQSVAEIIFDWAVNSGITRAIRKTQRLIGHPVTGEMTDSDISLINKAQPKPLFDIIMAAREAYYYTIVKNDKTQKKFLKGWLNRIHSIKFKS